MLIFMTKKTVLDAIFTWSEEDYSQLDIDAFAIMMDVNRF